ncbi:MAG: hypothetical protein WC565_04260 [Parcubacteria group bacterium]
MNPSTKPARPRLTPTAKREAAAVLDDAVVSVTVHTPRLRRLLLEQSRMQDVTRRHYWRHGDQALLLWDMSQVFAADLASEVRSSALSRLGVSDEGKAVVAIARVRLARQAVASLPSDTLASREPGWVLVRQAKRRAERVEAARRALENLVAGAYRRASYRRATSAWVGGENSLRVWTGDEAGVTATTYTVWHKRHAWKGSNLEVTLTVPQDWEATVLDRGLDVVEERLTLSAVPVSITETEEVYEAVWVEQSRGLSLVTARGVIYRRRSRGAGSAWLPWVHAQSLRGARAVYARQMAQTKEVA